MTYNCQKEKKEEQMTLEEFVPSMEEMWKKAKRIHGIIKENGNLLDFRMGVQSAAYWDEIANRLKRGFFRKPFLKSNKNWIRDLMANDSNAFALLACNIRIELIVDGSLRQWNGVGNEITRRADDPLDFLQDNLGPYLFYFILGTRYDLFAEVLDNLPQVSEKGDS